MIEELKKGYSAKVVIRKVFFTLFILAVYILGRRIPLPYIQPHDPTTGILHADIITFASMVAGGDVSRQSILVLGIGPYMSTMMIWRFLSMTDWYQSKKFTQDQSGKHQTFISLMIAIIQALGLYGSLSLSVPSTASLMILIILIMVAGSMFTMWLGNMNSERGIGKIMIFIIVGVLSRFPIVPDAYSYYWQEIATIKEQQIIYILCIIGIISLVFTVLFELAEVRIPLRRVMIDSQYNRDSYLPIKLNPSGGMAIMYAMTFIALPQYFIQAIELFTGPNQSLASIRLYFGLNTYSGAIIYVVIIFILSMLMSLVNVMPSQLAKNYKKHGDYLVNIRPGRPTEYYITRSVLRLAFIGAVYITLVAGLPMIFAVKLPQLRQLLMIPGTFIILASLSFTIVLELRAYYDKGLYSPLFES